MTTYNTGNPVPSIDPKDLVDNAQTIDEYVNSDSLTTETRLAVFRRTLAGADAQFDAAQDQRESEFDAAQADKQARFNAFIAASGYTGTGAGGAIEDYAAGITITEYNQIIRDADGEFWRVSGPTDLPYTTTGAGLPEGGALVSVGDAALRQELASDTGSELVTFLQAGTGAVARDLQDRGRDWVSVKDFGAVGDGVTDDTEAFKAAWKYAVTQQRELYLPDGTYLITKHGALSAFNTAGLYSATLTGESKFGTIIRFDPSNTAVDGVSAWLYDNVDFTAGNLFRVVFDKVRIDCVNTLGLTDIGICRWYGRSGVPTHDWNFQNCYLSGPSNATAFKVVSSVNVSENKWTSTTIRGFKTILDLDSDQSVNHNFIGCDIELFHGDAFKITRGGAINIFGGSIVPADSAVGPNSFINLQSTAAGLVSFVNVYGARFECRNVNFVIVRATGFDNVMDVNFIGCDFNQSVFPGIGARGLFDVNSRCGVSIFFKNCYIPSFLFGYIKSTATTGWQLASGIKPLIDFDKCKFNKSDVSSIFLFESINPAVCDAFIRSRGGYAKSGTNIVSQVYDFDITTGGALSGTGIRRALKSTEMRVKYWPNVSLSRSGTKTIFPIGSVITNVRIRRRGYAASSANIRYAITNENYSICFGVTQSVQQRNLLTYDTGSIDHYFALDSTADERSLKIVPVTRLDYTTLVGSVNLFDTVTGGTSGATGVILAFENVAGTDGDAIIFRITGTFSIGETVSASSGGSIVLSGVVSFEGVGQAEIVSGRDGIFVQYV